MQTSEQINEIAAAYAKAQIEMKNPTFDKKNGGFNSMYASLASVREAVVPVLAKHGIGVIQEIKDANHGVECHNLLVHASGQWMKMEPFWVPAMKDNAHGFGSASTYARRYSLMALACVFGDELDDQDDDSNAASGVTEKVAARAKSQSTPKPQAKPKNEPSLGDITAYLAESKDMADLEDRWKKTNERLKDYPELLEKAQLRYAVYTFAAAFKEATSIKGLNTLWEDAKAMCKETTDTKAYEYLNGEYTANLARFETKEAA